MPIDFRQLLRRDAGDNQTIAQLAGLLEHQTGVDGAAQGEQLVDAPLHQLVRQRGRSHASRFLGEARSRPNGPTTLSLKSAIRNPRGRALLAPTQGHARDTEKNKGTNKNDGSINAKQAERASEGQPPYARWQAQQHQDEHDRGSNDDDTASLAKTSTDNDNDKKQTPSRKRETLNTNAGAKPDNRKHTRNLNKSSDKNQ